MSFNRAGFYIKSQDKTFSIHDYYTFSPTPICDISIILDDELCSLLSNAQRMLGLLEGSCRHINCIENINMLLLKKEAVSSCTIDDEENFSYLDLFIPLNHNMDKITPVLNYMKALDYGIDKLNHMQLTNKLLFSIHEILMAHKCGKEIIGNIRDKQNIIGDYVVNVSDMPTYNPPNPNELGSYMMDIQKFIRRTDATDTLIKAALLHYQIEVVHPFESGNGKIGRIVMLLYLFKMKILTSSILPISEFFETHKVEYFDRIKAVHNLGEYEQLIKFFLKALIISADVSIRQIENVLQLRNKNLAIIKANANNTRDEIYLLSAHQYMEKHVFLNVASLADGIGVSYNTAAKIIRTFTDLGILKLMKEQERNKIYLYDDLLTSMGVIV